jgi:hypothetical protein
MLATVVLRCSDHLFNFSDGVDRDTNGSQSMICVISAVVFVIVSPGVVNDVVILDRERYGIVALIVSQLVVERGVP